jgi:hypothetical protein
MGISLHLGPIREPRGGGGSLTGKFEKRTKESSRNRVLLSMGAMGTWRKGSFTVDNERYVKAVSGNGPISL